MLTVDTDNTHAPTTLATGSDWENSDITRYGVVNTDSGFAKTGNLCFS